uniref:Uncharacterized protein n=1 Tax=Rhipicephalus zambeziensis TaxID=60191 RepID=A0A224YCP0_9ACAR
MMERGEGCGWVALAANVNFDRKSAVPMAGARYISAGISTWFVRPPMCCVLKAKRLRENGSSPWRPLILLHQHFVELREIGFKRVSCRPYFA